MTQVTNFNELSKKCSAAIKELNASLTVFSSTFKNLPVSEFIKTKRVNRSLKEKAGWYACIVNPNIDVLLLQEYFDSRQSRNILIKKETEQYNITVNHFEELKALNSHASVYENLLVEKNEEPQGFDLFSSPVVARHKCPDPLRQLFAQWQLKDEGETELEKVFYRFCTWHSRNNFSFTGQRHFILWFNYQMWKLFGDASLLFNFEHHFFHHWNKESRSDEQGLRQLVHFMQEACSSLQTELKEIYRTEVHYDTFGPHQKIANNFLYLSGFCCAKQSVNPDDYSMQLNKVLFKKGFVEAGDITARLQLEKVKLTIQNWYNAGLVDVVCDEHGWYACLIPLEKETERLKGYCNIKFARVEPDWSKILVKPVIKIQAAEKHVEPQVRQVSGQKAFFG
jgi:hypothetical protein